MNDRAAVGGNRVEVPIASLREADSPRLDGLDHQHARALAELDVELPPILVNRSTMQVIDGMHRLRAALENGKDRIHAEFFDGTDEEAFLLGVKANVAHGLPLTLADRRAAAKRIVQSHQHLSDRSIAITAGLAAKTVAAIRRRLSDSQPATTARVGRDGRVRPLDAAAGRRLAGAVIAARPNASLREIAREAGISIGTARDVRERVRAGEDPVSPLHRATTNEGGLAGRIPQHVDEAAARSILHGLRRDPSLRYTEAGRSVLQWLDSHLLMPAEWERMFDDIPPHSAILVSKIARGCAAEWLRLADDLERRRSDETPRASSW
jgi:ParB-like chromosome segregation protein Spo0J